MAVYIDIYDSLRSLVDVMTFEKGQKDELKFRDGFFGSRTVQVSVEAEKRGRGGTVHICRSPRSFGNNSEFGVDAIAHIRLRPRTGEQTQELHYEWGRPFFRRYVIISAR